MKTLPRLGLIAFVMAVLAIGCSVRRAQIRQSDGNFIGASRPSRLVVQIGNVTDENKSRRNQVELAVNGKKIKPSRTAEDRQSDYLYELSLPNGTHKIHAKYRAKSFWKDKEFTLATHDGRVRLYPGYTTFLTMNLEKKTDGRLTRDKVFFTETPRLMRTNATPQIAQTPSPERKVVAATRVVPVEIKLDRQENETTETAQEERPIRVIPVAPKTVAAPQILAPTRVNTTPATFSERAIPVVSLDRVAVPNKPVEQKLVSVAPSHTETMAPLLTVERAASIEAAPQASAAPAQISHIETSAALAGKIALQINTTPANAEVIVDDKYLGQSPLVTHVERGRSHVIQISKKGYAEKIKLLDLNEFGNQPTYFLIEKLEKEE